MTDFGDEIIAAALEVMEEVQIPATLVTGSGSFDTSNIQYNPGSTQTPISCSPLLQYDQHLIDDTNIRMGDAYVFYVPPATGGAVPERGQVLVLGEKRWNIVKVSYHNPDTRTAAYEIQLRA
jgi:hypothetical protein